MVSELVEITRAEGDPEARKFEIVDLEQVVNDIVSEERPDAELRECRLEVSGQLERPLWGDSELLRRAIANVLQNAIRYSPSHAAIEVTLVETADTSIVEIRDHGPGVSEELLSQIFKPFFRVEEARDTSSGGIGLGLSIAMRAVQVHQGAITAENAKPGSRYRSSCRVYPPREAGDRLAPFDGSAKVVASLTIIKIRYAAVRFQCT